MDDVHVSGMVAVGNFPVKEFLGPFFGLLSLRDLPSGPRKTAHSEPCRDTLRHVHVIRYSELTEIPWANGQGRTRELRRDPADSTLENFSWRVSIASVSHPGDFSTYIGVERSLLILSDSRLDVMIDDAEILLSRDDIIRFDGESRVALRSVSDAESFDLNLMTRRGMCHGEISIQAADHCALIVVEPFTTLIAVALDKEAEILGQSLQRWDCMLIDGVEDLTARGRFALVRILNC